MPADLIVHWLIQSFRRGGAPRHGLVCYLRENGPIAYSLDIFGRDPRERAGGMLATDLAWYWKTLGKTLGPESAAREWTCLTAWSLAAFLADMDAKQDGGAPALLIVAIDGHDAPAEIADADAVRWMKGFSVGSERPLHAVVSRSASGSGLPDLLFVAQHPIEPVRALLQAWGIDRDKAERRAYPRLQHHTLEDITRSLTS
jgi:hypothetical protein